MLPADELFSDGKLLPFLNAEAIPCERFVSRNTQISPPTSRNGGFRQSYKEFNFIIKVIVFSSSSSHEHEDLPRLSLDSEKPSFNNNPSPNPFASRRMRIIKPKAGSGSDTNDQTADASSGTQRSDSPRMNSSGKIMFQSLERSSSSPSSFNGGSRFKQRGVMERSYSANVRVAPVLNVVP
ncbi:protein RRNAD1-like [Hibiscus syriacus]|uniref:Protein RRNAD1-like n=1 Tax=Hibiscus syriacus TaxID=106335 RepID=A0A6A3A496_HIBSY|nr:protein RRNAD1-like [Hibiscus syriacus]